MDDIVFVAGKKKDFIDAVNESANSEGWAMSYEDYDAYLMWLGPDKFHHAVAKTKAGEFVGCCMCLNMDDMAFVALYYVRPQYRGKGIGQRLFKTVLPPALAEEKNVGLHAAPKMSSVYDNVLGFNKYTTWKSDVILLQDIDFAKLGEVLREQQYSVKDVSEVPIDELVAYDQTVYKSKREAFVQNFIARRKDAKCKVIFDKQGAIIGYGCAHSLSNGLPTLCPVIFDKQGAIIGYGCAHSLSNGLPTLCPVYCDKDDAFLALLSELLSCYSEELKKNNCVDLRPPSIKTARISTMLEGIAKVVKVIFDKQGAIIGYGCAHSLSNGLPTLCPIYCDKDDAFLALLSELLSCYSEELKKNNCVDLRPPSIKTARISAMLEGIAKVVKKADNSPQFTKFIPEHDALKGLMEEIVYIEGTNDDFHILVELANKYEGWMHSLSDYSVLKKALGDNVLLMVAKNTGGEFIGSCMSLVSGGIAFVGYYFVIPEYRGKGIGRRLFDSILTESMKTMNIGLHSASNREDNCGNMVTITSTIVIDDESSLLWNHHALKGLMEEIVYIEGTNDDFHILVELANKYEGWMHSLSDYSVLKKALGDNVLLMVAKNRGGEFIGSCMSLVSDGIAFVGYYFVIPEYRGKGIGRRLFDSILTESMKTMNIGLHSGRLHYLSQTFFSLLVQEQITPKKCVCSGMGDNIEVKKADEVTFSELCDYDDSITNSRREDFIRFTAVFREDAICKVIINENEKIVGFGRIRQSFNGSLIIGPIYCDSDANFIALFKSLIESYSKNISTSTNITMRSPSIKTAQIASLLCGAAEIMEVC
uniref:N-acetyltransferase domain-containing protein n=1 Tax=Ascaris lumbricoides TaxID=6252 RepID=A0A9J2Q6V3_ASCLU